MVLIPLHAKQNNKMVQREQDVEEDVEGKVKSLVGSILNHPTFRETIIDIVSPESNPTSEIQKSQLLMQVEDRNIRPRPNGNNLLLLMLDVRCQDQQ